MCYRLKIKTIIIIIILSFMNAVIFCDFLVCVCVCVGGGGGGGGKNPQSSPLDSCMCLISIFLY